MGTEKKGHIPKLSRFCILKKKCFFKMIRKSVKNLWVMSFYFQPIGFNIISLNTCNSSIVLC